MLPPAAVIGIGLAFGDFSISRNATALLVINVLALDGLGSMLIFILRGMRKKHFDLERAIRSVVENWLEKLSHTAYTNSIIDVSLLSETEARVEVTVRDCTEIVPSTFAESMAAQIKTTSQCYSDVIVEIHGCQVSKTG